MRVCREKDATGVVGIEIKILFCPHNHNDPAMHTYWRLLSFARPIRKYAIPYFFYTLFYTIFYTFTFTLIQPILQTLFSANAATTLVTTFPKFSSIQVFFREQSVI